MTKSTEALAQLLLAIGTADADAARYDKNGNGAAAQAADEHAERCRETARATILSAFPGISWRTIERARL